MFTKNTGYTCHPTVCRFCSCAILSKHYTALFSAGSLSKRLPVRMARLFDVSVSEHGLPSFICRGCLRQAEGLESKLDGLRSQARESYRHLHTSRKRPKETSSLDVSPHTAHSRPPAKQFMSSRRLFDDQDSKCKT